LLYINLLLFQKNTKNNLLTGFNIKNLKLYIIMKNWCKFRCKFRCK